MFTNEQNINYKYFLTKIFNCESLMFTTDVVYETLLFISTRYHTQLYFPWIDITNLMPFNPS